MRILRKCFLVLMRGVFQQLRCSQFNTYTVKHPKQAHGLIFFRRWSKGDFKIVMQIYMDQCISVTCFYCLSIVFTMFRQKDNKEFFTIQEKDPAIAHFNNSYSGKWNCKRLDTYKCNKSNLFQGDYISEITLVRC